MNHHILLNIRKQKLRIIYEWLCLLYGGLECGNYIFDSREASINTLSY
jgi:hypothetical protein